MKSCGHWERGIDIIGLLPTGKFLAVECKRPGEEPRPNQELFLDDVRRHGGVGVVAHNLEELQEALAECF